MRLTKKTRLVTLTLLAVFVIVALAFCLPSLGHQYAYANSDSPYYFDENDEVDESLGWVHVNLLPVFPAGQTKLLADAESVTLRMTATNENAFNLFSIQYFMYWDADVFGTPTFEKVMTSQLDEADHSSDENHIWANPENSNTTNAKDIYIVDWTFPIKKGDDGNSVLQAGHKYHFTFAHAPSWTITENTPDHHWPDPDLVTLSDASEGWENQMALDYDIGYVAVQFHDLTLEVASANTGLNALTVGGKAPTSGFTPNQATGNQENIVFADVPYATTSVNVVATLSDSTAAVTGTGSWGLSVGPNTRVVTVTHGTQVSKYTLKINRLKDTTAQLQLLSVKAGSTELLTGNQAFNATKKSYEVQVPYLTTSVSFTATAISTATAAPASGSLNLNVGSNNKIEIEVTAQDGTTKAPYTVTITRIPASAIDTLNALSVKFNATELLAGEQAFRSDKTDYTVEIPYKIEQLEVAASATDSLAKDVVGDLGTISFPKSESSKELKITVTAENNSTKEYTIIVNRTPISGDTTLKSLVVEGQNLSQEFDPEVKSYDLEEDILPTVTSLVINAEANFEDATLTFTPALENGRVSLQDGAGFILIKVTAQNGAVRDYVINYKKATASTDATLSSLFVDDQVLAPSFDRYTTDYSLQAVENTVESLIIRATASDSKATVAGIGFTMEDGIGEFVLQDGSNSIEIEVTAENGSYKKYTITVTRKAAVNEEAPQLESLSVKAYGSDDELLVGDNLFGADELAYTLQVANDIEFVQIAATPQEGGSVTGDVGTRTLKVGANIFEVVVSNESNLSNRYTITITRSNPLDKSALLQSLSVDGHDIIPAFNETTLNYTLTVDYSVDYVVVSAVAKSPATLVTTVGRVDLAVGENNKVEIEVAAQDPSVPNNIYTIIITRSPSADTTNTFTATLKNSANKDLLGKPSSDGNYAVTVNPDAGTLTLEVNATSDSAIAKINDVGASQSATLQIVVGDLKSGVNTFNITIKPAHGDERSCKLTIYVEATIDRPAELITFKANNAEYDAVLPSWGTYIVDYPEGITSLEYEVKIPHTTAVIMVGDRMFVEKKDAVPCDGKEPMNVILVIDDKTSYPIMLRPMSVQQGAPWMEFGNAADSKLQFSGITFKELSDEKSNVVARNATVSAASTKVSFKTNILPSTTQLTAVYPAGDFTLVKQMAENGQTWEFTIDNLSEGNNVIVYTVYDEELFLNKTVVMEIWKPITGSDISAKPVSIGFSTAVMEGASQVLKLTGEADLTEESLKSLIITVTYEDGSVITGKASELGATVSANKEAKTIKVAMNSVSSVTAECNYDIVKSGNNVGLIVSLVLFIVIAVGAALVMVLFILKWKKAVSGEHRSSDVD